jgi:hypothetical protein
MLDCKSCGMSYDEKKYEFCPYCGEKPQEDIAVVGDKDINLPAQEDTKSDEPEGALKSELETRNKVQKDIIEKEPREPKESKPMGSTIKYVAIAFVALAVIAAIVFTLSSFGDTGITVPDKYDTIQEAIDAAADGDEIVVQVGVYRENIDFKGKNIILRSVDPDDSAIVSETIIDGSGSGTVVSFRSGENEGAVLSGFTITRGGGVLVSGGSSPVIEKCIIEDNTAEFGAGIVVFDSAPTIRGNLITGNSGFLGGGMFIEESSPLILDNTIVGNRAEMGGGMVVISNSAPTVTGNVIADNIAARLGGGLVVALNSTPTISENVITANRADRNGGGVLIEESEPVLENNDITLNRAANGGGIFIVNSLSTALSIKGNNIADNLAFLAGGAVYMEGSSPSLENNEFLNNISELLGGAVAVYNSAPIFRANLFENNQAQDESRGGAIWVSANSNLELADPDDNTYLQNIPDDLYQE